MSKISWMAINHRTAASGKSSRKKFRTCLVIADLPSTLYPFAFNSAFTLTSISLAVPCAFLRRKGFFFQRAAA